jgi:hypothetical protein
MMYAERQTGNPSNGQSDERDYAVVKVCYYQRVLLNPQEHRRRWPYSILIFTALTSDTMVLLNMYPMAAMLNILCKG